MLFLLVCVIVLCVACVLFLVVFCFCLCVVVVLTLFFCEWSVWFVCRVTAYGVCFKFLFSIVVDMCCYDCL